MDVELILDLVIAGLLTAAVILNTAALVLVVRERREVRALRREVDRAVFVIPSGGDVTVRHDRSVSTRPPQRRVVR